MGRPGDLAGHLQDGGRQRHLGSRARDHDGLRDRVPGRPSRMHAHPAGAAGRRAGAEDDPCQRRGVARATDRGARRLLPGRVQARPRRPVCSTGWSCTASQTSTPPATGQPPTGAREGPARRDRHGDRLPPAPRGDPSARTQRSGSPAPRRNASATTPRASRCGGSAGAPTRCATSAPSASGHSPRPTPRWRHANPRRRPPSTPSQEHPLAQAPPAQHPARHVLLGPPPTALYLLALMALLAGTVVLLTRRSGRGKAARAARFATRGELDALHVRDPEPGG